jgi:hypothetical protein
MPRQETVLIGGVVLVAAATVGAFAWQIGQRRSLTDEGSRMQSLYVALSLYEQAWNGALPSDLTACEPYLQVRSHFQSPKDPFTGASGPFPNDAGLPGGKRKAEQRISDSYLYAHAAVQRIRVAPWQEAKYDATLGLIANEWFGTVSPKADFQADVSGLVLRITTAGNMVRVKRDGPKPLGNAEDLFRRKPERK